MHPSPPMPEEIRAGFYPGFERAWRCVELVGRTVMLLVIVATMGGLLGGGPKSLWTRTAGSGPLRVEYAPVVRFGTPTGVTVHAAAPEGGEVEVTLPASIVGDLGLQGAFPRPAAWRTDGRGDLHMTLALQPGAREATVQLAGMPAVEGLLRFSARLGPDGPAVRWSQFVLP